MGDLERAQIGFLGAGAMAEALAGGLVQSGAVAPERLRASDPDPGRRKHLEESLGISCSPRNEAVVADSDVVVVAVKPDKVEPVLAELAPHAPGRLWISIAAGVPLATLQRALSPEARLVRAMPNTPAQVHAAATALCAAPTASAADREIARALFTAVGRVWESPSEELLDAVTGLSGGGPAYVFVFLEALADAGVRMGLPRSAAATLAAQTVFGAAKLVLESGAHPAELKDRVTSPGGTTIAGLERLEAGGMRGALYAAVEAATARARALRAPGAPGRAESDTE